MVSLTPGSLGIREGIFVITSDILGITSDQVMQLALLDRVVMVVTLVVLFLVLFLLQLIINKIGVNKQVSHEEKFKDF